VTQTLFFTKGDRACAHKQRKTHLHAQKVGCSLQGALAQAKISEELLWEEKFHAANGKAPSCTHGGLPFLLFSFGGRGVGEERFFFPFYPGSQCVLIMFHLSSQWVPIRLSICVSSSQCVPQNVLNSTSLESHMLWQMLSSFHLCS